MDDIYIKRVLNGEPNAFTYLVQQYQSIAMKSAMSIVKNETDAKDIVQTSFIQAYESLHSFREESKFSTWLCRIVVNTSFRFIQNNVKYKNLIKQGMNNDLSNAHNEALLTLNREDLENLLKKGLELLAPKEAICLQLFYLEEYHLDEIEKITGFTNSNIKVLLFRGRKNLHKHLIMSYNRLK